MTDTPVGKRSIWARLGSWCYRKRRVVLVAWLVALVGVNAIAGAVGVNSDAGVSSPDSDSQRGFDLLQQHFGGGGSQWSGSLVVKAERGINDPEVTRLFSDLIAKTDGAFDPESLLTVTSPYGPAAKLRNLVAPNGQIAYAPVDFTSQANDTKAAAIGKKIIAEVNDRAAEYQAAGMQVEVGGAALGPFEPPSSELLGLAFAIVILILAFGSVLAMGLPIGIALFGVGAGIGVINLLTNVMTVPAFATTLGAMIGLGVGIDYALFIITRYREGTHRGLSGHDAMVAALDTAGRAVVFAGVTVVISLMGMFVMGLPFINGLATGAAVTVTVTLLATITLLPALVGFAKHRVELTRWRGLIMAAGAAIAMLGAGLKVAPIAALGAIILVVTLLASFFVPALRKALPQRATKPLEQTFAYRWSRFVQRRPWPIAIGSALVLLVLASPVLSMRLGFSDESTFSADTTTRKAYDLLAEGFGAGSNGPLILAAKLGAPSDLAAAQQLVSTLQSTPGIAAAVGPIPSPDQQAFQILAIPTTGPQEEATADLVRNLRSDVVPPIASQLSNPIYIAGAVPAGVDFSNYLGSRLVWFFAAVLTLSFLLLAVVFRSVLVPLKAVIMNLLSIGASYGIVVAVFQKGIGIDLINSATGPIEPFLPMMLFAIVFGLSMDYEVFLLARVKEDFDRTGDPVHSVANGLAATARVITAAAAIMVVVFGAFMLEDNRVVKLFGLGLAIAILLDATLVRMLLVPATMELLGARNWWMPRWLDRLLPNLDVEGHAATEALTAAGTASAAGAVGAVGMIETSETTSV